METKQCPYCGEEILLAAKKCKHCGEWLEEKTAAKPVETMPEQPAAPQSESVPKTEQKPAPTFAPEADAVAPDEKIGFFSYYLDQVWAPRFERGEGEGYVFIPGFEFMKPLPRKRFWLSLLLITLAYGFIIWVLFSPTKIVEYWHQSHGLKQIFHTLFAAAVFPLFIAKIIELQIRRLRDIGKSGWWLLVPVANIIFYCQRGSESQKTSWVKRDWAQFVVIVIILISAFMLSKSIFSVNNDDTAVIESRADNYDYVLYGAKWVKNCDGSRYYTVASTDKDDTQPDDPDVLIRTHCTGHIAIVSATSVDGAMTPVITAEDIVENDVDINDWHSLYFDLLPSSVDSNLLYFNYCIVGQGGPISCGAVDCSTGEFALYNGAILGTIQKGTYIHSLLVEDDRARKLYIMDPFEPGEQATYQEELDFSYLQNNTAEEIIAWIGRQ